MTELGIGGPMRFWPSGSKGPVQTTQPGIGEVIEAYDRLIDGAVETTVQRHRAGADDEVVLTETLIAVRTAQALQKLTGVEWHEQLENRTGDALPPEPGGSSRAPAGS